MTHAEQKRLIADLMDHQMKMTRAEQETFDMFRKRNKDDEDLDKLSRAKLVDMHEKYVVASRPKGNPLDALFGKKP